MVLSQLKKKKPGMVIKVMNNITVCHLVTLKVLETPL